MNIKLSYEFFPPKTLTGVEKLLNTAAMLEKNQPKYFSLTHGAGGSSNDLIEVSLKTLANSFSTPIIPHLTCIGSSKEKIRHDILKYKNLGINSIVALRGDLPENTINIGEFSYANELVNFVREETGSHFKIIVAAYPETHPEALSSEHDLKNLQRKFLAGADHAITQFFYDADNFFRFVDSCKQIGINNPIVPGILPITNWQKLCEFSNKCGAKLPKNLHNKIAPFAEDSDYVIKIGLEIVTNLCEKLIANGFSQLHFFTLNNFLPTSKICENLGVV